MKKLFAVLLALAMVLGMAACAGGGDDVTNVSVFWYDESDVYLGSVRAALNAELDKLENVEYDNQFAANNQTTQLDQITTAIANGADILVVNVVTSGAVDIAQQVLDKAGDIPVIFFNRAIGAEDSEVSFLKDNENVCFIGTDAPEAGHIQGKMIGEYLVANFDTVDLNGDGKISYAMMKGQEGNVEAEYRTQYGVEDANAVLTEAGKSELVYFDASNTDKYQVDPDGAWSSKAGKEYMDTNLVSYNEANGNMIELVICNNDGMAEGVVAALQEKGYNKEGGHHIPVFGVDATDNAKALIAAGAMTGTVKQDAEGMASAIAGTVKAIIGGSSCTAAPATLKDDRFTIDSTNSNKLYVAYAAYTGE